MSCPGCGQRAFARTSAKQTLTYREVYYICTNVEVCGSQFVVSMATVRVTVPTRLPEPLAKVPLSAWRRGGANVAPMALPATG